MAVMPSDDVAVVGHPLPAATGRRPLAATGPLEVIDAAERRGHRAAYGAMRAITAVLARAWSLTVDGIERLPATGPVIVAANHVSFLDSPLLMFRLPRRIWFLGKAEYMDSWTTRHLFPAVGMIPIERGGRRAAIAALRTALGVLERDQAIGIYPEGTRSRDGRLHRGHTGLAWLAFRSGAPIVPVGIRGTAEVQPPGARLPRPTGRCSVTIGEPVPMSRYEPRDRRMQRVLTDDVMFEIAQLSGQEYVDEYAANTAADDGDG